jgi:hypothetical protein
MGTSSRCSRAARTSRLVNASSSGRTSRKTAPCSALATISTTPSSTRSHVVETVLPTAGRIKDRRTEVSRILCVHGVGQQRECPDTLHAEWFPALSDGCLLAGEQLSAADVTCVFYGNLFRPPGRALAVGDPMIAPEDLDEFEAELLGVWWQEAARVDSAVVAPDAQTLVATPPTVQRALRALSGSSFFAGLADRALLFDLRQVRRYFQEPEVRQAAQQALAAAMTPEVRVVVGHSLGSVVAYETLCAHPAWSVEMLLTLGSPLGIRHLIFDRLQPAPALGSPDDPQGIWPESVGRWVNIADKGDVVALEKDLRRRFGSRVDGYLVSNGATAHGIRPYLTAAETGRAIVQGLDVR